MTFPLALRRPLVLPTPRCQSPRHEKMVVTLRATDAEERRAACAAPTRERLSGIGLAVVPNIPLSGGAEAMDIVGRRIFLTRPKVMERAPTAREGCLEYTARMITAYQHAPSRHGARLRMR